MYAATTTASIRTATGGSTEKNRRRRMLKVCTVLVFIFYFHTRKKLKIIDTEARPPTILLTQWRRRGSRRLMSGNFYYPLPTPDPQNSSPPRIRPLLPGGEGWRGASASERRWVPSISRWDGGGEKLPVFHRERLSGDTDPDGAYTYTSA